VHAWLELVPLVAIALIAVMHWPETKALFGFREGPLDLSLRLRETKLPLWYRVGLLSAVALFNGFPYVEELWRSLRANDGRLVPAARPRPNGESSFRGRPGAHCRRENRRNPVRLLLPWRRKAEERRISGILPETHYSAGKFRCSPSRDPCSAGRGFARSRVVTPCLPSGKAG
jgi:hypothetical protein